jgi:hypothetical protein
MIPYYDSLDALARQYHEQKYLLFRPFIGFSLTSRLLESLQGLPVRAVICGNPQIRFGQQDVAEPHPLARFFQEREVVNLVLAIAQATRFRHCRCWTSVYGPGEYINAHRDRAGDIQLLICLQAPPDAGCGGSLQLRSPTGELSLFLVPGDAILFEASSVEHETTPLLPTEQEPHPTRTVAVGRYFLDYHW